MIEIGYCTHISELYIKELRECKNFQDLQAFVWKWRPIANDAFEVVSKMTAKDFPEFVRGLALEKKNYVHGAGPEWQEKYGAIVIPEIILRVGMLAEHFKAPEGCAFIRCRQEGLLKKKKGIYYLKEKGDDRKK